MLDADAFGLIGRGDVPQHVIVLYPVLGGSLGAGQRGAIFTLSGFGSALCFLLTLAFFQHHHFFASRWGCLCGLTDSPARSCLYRRSPRITDDRQVQQHGVLPQHTASGPAGLYQKVEIGLHDGFAGLDYHQPRAVLAHIHFKLQLGQQVVEVDPGFFKVLSRGQLDGYLVTAQISGITQRNASFQRLIECRIQAQFTHTQRVAQ